MLIELGRLVLQVAQWNSLSTKGHYEDTVLQLLSLER